MTFLKSTKECTGKEEFKETAMRKTIITIRAAHKERGGTQFKVNPLTVEAAGESALMMQQNGEVGVVDLVAWSAPKLTGHALKQVAHVIDVYLPLVQANGIQPAGCVGQVE